MHDSFPREGTSFEQPQPPRLEGLEGGAANPYFGTDSIPQHEWAYLESHIPIDADRWPEMKFSFDREKIVGNGVVLATRASRLRGLVGACGEQLGVLFHASMNTSYDNVTESLDAVNKFMKMPVTVGASKLTKEEMLPQDHALAVIEKYWREVNHPFIQALWQIENEFVNDEGGLDALDFRRLARDTMLATHQMMYMDLYIDFKHELKRALDLQTRAPA